jgi:hypothetical protein
MSCLFTSEYLTRLYDGQERRETSYFSFNCGSKSNYFLNCLLKQLPDFLFILLKAHHSIMNGKYHTILCQWYSKTIQNNIGFNPHQDMTENLIFF